MRNLLLTICYDGSHYHGWQIQQNAVSVQQVFQDALFKVIGEKPDIKGCSRTDSFVHARQFCISLKTEHSIPCERFVGALNHFLPEDIAVLGCREVSPEFHARYSCAGKEYIYQIWNNPVRNPFLNHRALHYWYALDEKRLNEAAGFFTGRHDFTSFCTMDARERGDLTRTVTKKGRRPRHLYRGGGRLFIQYGAHYGRHASACGAGKTGTAGSCGYHRSEKPRCRRPDRAALGIVFKPCFL